MATPFMGVISMFGGNFAPRGYALCQGQIQSIAQNTALFSLLGTTYGGDGQTTFALPDLRGRAPIHQGNLAGGSNYVIGQVLGTESVTLTSSQMPQHSHSLGANSSPGSGAGPTGAVWAAYAAGQNYAAAASANTAMNAGALSLAGGNQPHENMQPYLAINFIIALEGVFPPRN